MNGKVTYSYMPESWSQEEFLRLGGFTVVFLNYNKAKFIEKSVASALAQDFPLCEMFFMDDASTDGSGDTMERLVRAYRGRHKVTVVRNDENQHICGQWNLVSKLATGNWLGMFCGDDVAHPDRVSVAAKRIAECPTLRGLCTAANEIAALSDCEKGFMPEKYRQLIYQTGDADLHALMMQDPPIIGATAWWHRSLFEDPLPKGPLDDIILRWILQLKYRDSRDPIWLWDGVDKTVDYSVGVGITSDHNLQNVSRKSPMEIWLGRTAANRHFAQVAIKTWQGILDYYQKHDAPKSLMQTVRDAITHYRIVKGNTLLRLLDFPSAIRSPVNRRLWFKLNWVAD